MAKRKYKKLKERVIAVVFLTWFVLSFMGIIYFSKLENDYMTVIFFGQYFFLFSMLGFFDREAPLELLMHLTVGIACMVVPGIMKVFPIFSDLGTIDIIKIIICVIALLLGYILLILSRNKYNDKVFRKLYIGSFISFVTAISIIILFCL